MKRPQHMLPGDFEARPIDTPRSPGMLSHDEVGTISRHGFIFCSQCCPKILPDTSVVVRRDAAHHATKRCDLCQRVLVEVTR